MGILSFTVILDLDRRGTKTPTYGVICFNVCRLGYFVPMFIIEILDFIMMLGVFFNAP